MQKAKQAVGDFMAKAGHHDTTVHEKVAPAVVKETVNQHRHEEVQTAIDKEIHQDHYHTSVQPVYDREVLPEQHSHNLAPVQHKELHHGNTQDITARLQQEAAQFKDERVVAPTKHTQATGGVIAGEHIHHHVHETIQPVVHKEVIQSHVVHTTVPIHEVHHNAPQHHSVSALPAVSMADFKQQGGVLSGREERYDGFKGEPRSVGSALGGAGAVAGAAGIAGASGRRHRTGSNSSSSSDEGRRTRTGTSTKANKPSLADKMNPKIDADGDGKAGFMS